MFQKKKKPKKQDGKNNKYTISCLLPPLKFFILIKECRFATSSYVFESLNSR